jgi:hypothetical protein
MERIDNILFEIKKSINKVKYFTHHALRCKNSADVIKLTMYVAINVAYITALTNQLRPPREEVLLIELT